MGPLSLATALLMVGFQLYHPEPLKIPIHHADPWMVKAMLEGTAPGEPELSTLWGVRGGGSRGSGGQQSGQSPFLTDGYLVVNPTDNSLWWYPKSGK